MVEPVKPDSSAAAPSIPPKENGKTIMASEKPTNGAPANTDGEQSNRKPNRDTHRDNHRFHQNKGRGGRGGRGGGGRGGRGGRGGDSRGGNTDRRKIQDNKRRRRDERENAVATTADGEGQGDGEGGDNATTEEQKGSNMSIRFSAEEIAAEDRRPKRKVAVLIGYAGTGYKGMQMNHHEKTIEGDLFAAFVAAGAIQKRNADDPKKSSFVRCARTDKGVHAAGNVISLKLTVDDPEIVDKINEQLPEQIRVWGALRTNNAFNCYQACDSRWYEYLMPSYTLLPPHPQTFLGKKVIEAAKEKGVYDECLRAWDDVKDYWDEVEKNDIRPILDRLDEKSREEVLRTMHATTDAQGNPQEEDAPMAGAEDEESGGSRKRKAEEDGADGSAAKKAKTEESSVGDPVLPSAVDGEAKTEDVEAEDSAVNEPSQDTEKPTQTEAPTANGSTEDGDATAAPKPKYQPSAAEIALKEIKAAYVAAKRRYRVTTPRIEQLQAALDLYQGTNNFHNYTIQKTFRDPSAKRHIRSFIVNPKPIQIRDTEWLSLKVHGQSFMMHQIRKMVAMAVLCVRCAAPLDRIKQSYGPTRISVPKAPGLGLLLERPVFESYSKKAQDSFGKEPLNFDKYEKQIEEFKHRQIYTRIWDTEEKEASFHVFLHQLDSFNTDYFLWLTAHGFDAAYEPKERHDPKQKPALKAVEAELVGSDDEDVPDGDGNGNEG